MYTQCPSCQTVFRISAAQLQMAHGKVRCSHCHEIFNALEHLKEDANKKAGKAAKTATNDTISPQREQKSTNATQPELSPEEIQERHAFLENILELDEVVELPGSKISLGQRLKTNITWILGILLLILLLFIQYSYFLRIELSQDKDWRPWLSALCQLANCTVPPQRNIKAIHITNRDIRQHPRTDNALLINVTMKNDASFTQPFPNMLMRMTGTNGVIVAKRLFRPQEYLGKQSAVVTSMKPNGLVHFVLEIVDPGSDATGFQLELLQE